MSGSENRDGAFNSFFGWLSGRDNTNGNNNAFFGFNSGSNNSSGHCNSFFGASSGIGSSGYGNIAIGYRSGSYIRNGTKNIMIGYSAGPSFNQSNQSNQLYIDIEQSDTPLIYGDFQEDSIRINGDLAVQGIITGEIQGIVSGDVTGSIRGRLTSDSTLMLIHLGENDDKGIILAENENPVFGILYDGEGDGDNNRFHFKKLLGGTETIATFTGHGTVGIGIESPHALLHVQGAVDANLAGGGHLMTGSEGGINIVMDNNEIIARDNGQASELYLNKESGEVILGGKLRIANNTTSDHPGQIRYNTSTNDFEGYDGLSWYSLTTNKSSFASIVSSVSKNNTLVAVNSDQHKFEKLEARIVKLEQIIEELLTKMNE